LSIQEHSYDQVYWNIHELHQNQVLGLIEEIPLTIRERIEDSDCQLDSET